MTRHQVWTDEHRLTSELELLKWRRGAGQHPGCVGLYMTDEDELLVRDPTLMTAEYHWCRTVAKIDYKTHDHWQLDTSITVQWHGAYALGVPMYVVEFYPQPDDTWHFVVNTIGPVEPLGARDFQSLWPRDLQVVHQGTYTENEYVWWLHQLRGLICCRERLRG